MLITIFVISLTILFTKCQLETAFGILEWAFLACSTDCIAISLLIFIEDVLTSVVSTRRWRRWSSLGWVTARTILWKDDEFAGAATFIGHYAALMYGLLLLSRGEALSALALLSYRWRCGSCFLMQILVSVHWLMLLTVCVHWRLWPIEATWASLLELTSTFDSNLIQVRPSRLLLSHKLLISHGIRLAL